MEDDEARKLGIEGEIFEDRETILDLLWRRNLRGDEVPSYLNPPDYYNPG